MFTERSFFRWFVRWEISCRKTIIRLRFQFILKQEFFFKFVWIIGTFGMISKVSLFLWDECVVKQLGEESTCRVWHPTEWSCRPVASLRNKGGHETFKGGLQMAPYNMEDRENTWAKSNLQGGSSFYIGGLSHPMPPPGYEAVIAYL